MKPDCLKHVVYKRQRQDVPQLSWYHGTDYPKPEYVVISTGDPNSVNYLEHSQN